MPADGRYRVVVFNDEGTFVAQCLEHDICAFAPDLETLRGRFLDVFYIEANMGINDGTEPFSGIDPAPQKFQNMWPSLDAELGRLHYMNDSVVMAQAA